MSFKREESGDSGLEVSDPLRLTSNSPSAHGPITIAKPALERHISHIPTESDDDEEVVVVEDSNGIKSKLKKLKKRVSPSHEKASEKRHDSGNNATSDFEISPGINVSDHIDSTEYKSKAPTLERHVSSIGEDGLLNTTGHDQPRGRSPKLERHISGIPQDDYDSDREI